MKLWAVAVALTLIGSSSDVLAQTNFQSSKVSPGVVVQGESLNATRVTSGVVVNGAGFQSPRTTAGVVLQGSGLEAAKVSIGIVVQAAASGGIIIRAPLVHF